MTTAGTSVSVRARLLARPLGRVSLYVCALSLVAAIWLLRHAYAQAGERSLQLGRQLHELTAAVGGATPVRLNGQNLSLYSAITHTDLAQVLDGFGAMCASHPEELDQRAALQIAAARAQSSGPRALLRLPGSRDQATALCFSGLATSDLAGARTRLLAFGRTLDMAELGQLRYVFARRSAGKTHLLVAFSHGPLALKAMFPAHGDAPGEDTIPGVRPQGAERVLSAVVPGTDYGFNLYRVSAPAESSLDVVAAQLARDGYRSLAQRQIHDRVYARSLSRGRDALLLMAAPDGAHSLLFAMTLESDPSALPH